MAHVRGMGHKCIAAASSGIAATLLKGGRTIQFAKFLLDVGENNPTIKEYKLQT